MTSNTNVFERSHFTIRVKLAFGQYFFSKNDGGGKILKGGIYREECPHLKADFPNQQIASDDSLLFQ